MIAVRPWFYERSWNSHGTDITYNAALHPTQTKTALMTSSVMARMCQTCN